MAVKKKPVRRAPRQVSVGGTTITLDWHKIITGVMTGALAGGFVWWLNAREAINTIPDLKARVVLLEADKLLVARLDERLNGIQRSVDQILAALK
jgi:hypothetical protein